MKKGYNLVQVIIIVVVACLLSGLTTGVIITKNNNSKKSNYASLIEDKDLQNFLDVYSELVNDYYEDVDRSKLINGAIDGMTKSLDENYTSYLDENSANYLTNQLSGKYYGVGIVLKNNEVLSVLKNSPAEKSGVLEGDIINSINGISTENLDTSQITDLIKENETIVNMVITRDGNQLTFNIEMQSIDIPNVDYKIIEGTSIGYLQISIFSSSITNQVEEALVYFKKEKVTGLIIDLRGNTGGYLDQAYNVASFFTKKGKVIYSTESKNGKDVIKDTDDNKTDYNIVVLINKSTASASEVLAAALKDSYGATIVGTSSFGKGRVQHTYSLSNGSLVKYTTSKWYRPNGTCIDGQGIAPDYEIENEYLTTTNENGQQVIYSIIDNQLNKSVELLSK